LLLHCPIGDTGRHAWSRFLREQYLYRHVERIRRSWIGIDRGPVWPRDFRCCWRRRNNPRRARCGLSLAADTQNRRARPKFAVKIVGRPPRRTLFSLAFQRTEPAGAERYRREARRVNELARVN